MSKGDFMSNERKDRMYNEDIKIIESSFDYAKAFKILEQENTQYKNIIFQNLRKMKYAYS